MINAEKAREIQQAAQEEQDAYVRTIIAREVEDVCEHIARSARGRSNSCRIDASRLDYPKGVAEYLQAELGYTVRYSNYTIPTLTVSW